MMGPRQEAQAALFYEFSLEDHVPQDHLLRSIDRFVDLDGIRSYLTDFYSHTGRPSIDPELLIRMLLVGYCFGIRSERRLCEEVHLNLAYRWFCRLDLTDRIPDHSTFSKNRHGRFRESELLRHLFETTVARCIEEGLVSGQRMAIDASLIEADANKQNSTPKEEWDATNIDPADAPRAVREYLDTLDEAAFGAASEVQPKFTSHSDPASQWTAARKGPAFFSYSDNYLIDTDHGVIVDVEGTRSIRQAEVGSTKTMLNRVKAKDSAEFVSLASASFGASCRASQILTLLLAGDLPSSFATGGNSGFDGIRVSLAELKTALARGQDQWLTMEDLRRLLGFQHHEVRTLIFSGLLPHYSGSKAGKRRHAIVVMSSDYNAFLERFHTCRTAAKILRKNEKQLRSLIRSRRLKPAPEGGGARIYLLADLKRL